MHYLQPSEGNTALHPPQQSVAKKTKEKILQNKNLIMFTTVFEAIHFPKRWHTCWSLLCAASCRRMCTCMACCFCRACCRMYRTAAPRSSAMLAIRPACSCGLLSCACSPQSHGLSMTKCTSTTCDPSSRRHHMLPSPTMPSCAQQQLMYRLGFAMMHLSHAACHDVEGILQYQLARAIV